MDPSRYLNQSVLRSLNILEIFAKNPSPLAIPEIARRVGLHRSTVHRLLLTLEYAGWLRKIFGTETYALGLKVLTMADRAGSSLTSLSMVRPFLDELAQTTGETAVLSMADKIGAVCVDKIESSQRLKISSEIGQYFPLHAGGTGFAVLLGMPEEEVSAFLFRQPLPSFTDKTETDPDKLLERYRAMKKNGYAVSTGAVDPGVTGIAAPVFFSAENAYGSVGITMPAGRATEVVLSRMVGAVLETAEAMMRKVELSKREINP